MYKPNGVKKAFIKYSCLYQSLINTLLTFDSFSEALCVNNRLSVNQVLHKWY